MYVLESFPPHKELKKKNVVDVMFIHPSIYSSVIYSVVLGSVAGAGSINPSYRRTTMIHYTVYNAITIMYNIVSVSRCIQMNTFDRFSFLLLNITGNCIQFESSCRPWCWRYLAPVCSRSCTGMNSPLVCAGLWCCNYRRFAAGKTQTKTKQWQMMTTDFCTATSWK